VSSDRGLQHTETTEDKAAEPPDSPEPQSKSSEQIVITGLEIVKYLEDRQCIGSVFLLQ
jgi:hypothetical protein